MDLHQPAGHANQARIVDPRDHWSQREERDPLNGPPSQLFECRQNAGADDRQHRLRSAWGNGEPAGGHRHAPAKKGPMGSGEGRVHRRRPGHAHDGSANAQPVAYLKRGERIMRIPTLTIGCVLALALSLGAEAQPAPRFDETLAKIAVYEIGDNEAPLADLDRLVGAGSSSPDEVKRMEQAFLKALGGGTTLAGKDLICRRLSIVGSAASVPALTALLGAPETSDMARYALERIPGAAVNEAMRTMLPKALGKRRIGIVNTLGQRSDATSISALAGLI